MNKDQLLTYFSKLPEITTPRLILRRMKKTDWHDMYEYASLSDVTHYLTWEPHPNPAYTLRYLAYISSQYRQGNFYDWAIIWRENKKMIGTCGFTSFSMPHNSAEVGYVLNPNYWGKGIAPEALRAILQVGFYTLQLHRIEAKFIQGNDRSRSVMEKVGMTFEGMQRDAMIIKSRYTTIGVCAILASEFAAQTPRDFSKIELV